MSADFNPNRLELARRRRGKTKKVLAEEIGISQRALSAIAAGTSVPSVATVERLVEVLQFPHAFFLRDDVDAPAPEAVSFRALSRMTARQRDKAIGASALAIELADWISARFSLPTPKVPRLRDEDPAVAAERVRRAWGLGAGRIPNMVHLLESKGVRVFSLVEDAREVDAYSFWRGSEPWVFLNTTKTAERSRMDAAHELGHLVLHYWGGPQGQVAEREAQAFAAEFLMPRRSVLSDMPPNATVPQIIAGRARWNVSAMSLAYRLRQLNMLSEWQSRSAYIELGERGYRSGEPGGIKRETSLVFKKVLSELRSQEVRLAALAADLDVQLADLNDLTFGLWPLAEVPAPTPRGLETAPTPTAFPPLSIVEPLE